MTKRARKSEKTAPGILIDSIPPARVVRERLSKNLREAKTLRRLLRLAESIEKDRKQYETRPE